MIAVRAAREDDVPALVEAWHAMLEECDLLAPGLVSDWRSMLMAHFSRGLADGSTGWFVADADRAVVATAAAFLPPGGNAAIFRRPTATLAGIYVWPEFRRKGLARRLTLRALDWCRARGCYAVRLVASEMGRPLYESLGFEEGREMRLRFDERV